MTRSISQSEAATLVRGGAADGDTIQVIRAFRDDERASTFSARCENCWRWIHCGTEQRADSCVCGQRYRVVFDLAPRHRALLRISGSGSRCMDCGKAFDGTDRGVWRPQNAWQVQCGACVGSESPSAEKNLLAVEIQAFRASLGQFRGDGSRGLFKVNGHFRQDLLFFSLPTGGLDVMASTERFAELVRERVRALLGDDLAYLSFSASHIDDMLVGFHEPIPAALEAPGRQVVDGLMQTLKAHLREIKDSRQWMVPAAAPPAREDDVDVDMRAFQDELNRFTVQDIRFALHRVGDHPLRGPEKSRGTTGHGQVVEGQPVQGARVRESGGEVHFRITEVSGGSYGWDEFTMSRASFSGFVPAMLDLLRERRR